MGTYAKITNAFKKVGDYSLLTLSEIAHVVPRDGMELIEKKTGVSVNEQMTKSQVSEALEGAAFIGYGLLTFNPIATVAGVAMESDMMLRSTIDAVKGWRSASLAVEVPYQAGKLLYTGGKRAYNYLKS